ncbi:MAG: Xaa-Pro peptidase family protein, partial [Anaerolineae bacterium]|nr:Xaa-Pro peptidase family protein [Anaerolineae bacterium]
MNYGERLQVFQKSLGGMADAAFFPMSADLHYLTGVPRDIPNFGWTMHPGAWLEGIWIAPGKDAVLTLPRMTAEFGGLSDLKGVETRVLGDWDEPAALVSDILAKFDLPPNPRIAVGDRTHAETLIHLQNLLPGATFVSGTSILRQQRLIKSAEEIAVMRQAGAITEAAFADVIRNLKHGMTELDVISEVNYQLRRHGSLGESFTTSMYNSGPHHPLIFGDRADKSLRVLNPPVALLFDFGSIYDGFCYDYGRTVSFGQPDEEMQRVYNLIMQAQAAGVAALKVGENTTTQADA